MVTSPDQNVGQDHNIKTGNKSFESVEQFRYLGTTATNRKSIQEEIKSRLKLGNPCYISVQNLLYSSLLSTDIKIKIYRVTDGSRTALKKKYSVDFQVEMDLFLQN
jgi:hypothetical protein